jgi:hypothetical protein
LARTCLRRARKSPWRVIRGPSIIQRASMRRSRVGGSLATWESRCRMVADRRASGF